MAEMENFKEINYMLSKMYMTPLNRAYLQFNRFFLFGLSKSDVDAIQKFGEHEFNSGYVEGYNQAIDDFKTILRESKK